MRERPGSRGLALAVLVGLGLSIPSGASAARPEPPGGGSAKAQTHASKKSKAAAGEHRASEDAFDRKSVAIIREWFHDPDNLKGLPPGLAKRETLPPGLQRQLERNGTLPPGLQKKVQPLPADLERQLPPLPDGRRRIVIGGNVILLDATTGLILDTLEDVFR